MQWYHRQHSWYHTFARASAEGVKRPKNHVTPVSMVLYDQKTPFVAHCFSHLDLMNKNSAIDNTIGII